VTGIPHALACNRKEPNMRRTSSKFDSFAERIAEERRRIEAELAKLDTGPTRDALLKKLRQLDVAAHADQWLASPGLRSPK
jgi:hypothetical protein